FGFGFFLSGLLFHKGLFLSQCFGLSQFGLAKSGLFGGLFGFAFRHFGTFSFHRLLPRQFLGFPGGPLLGLFLRLGFRFGGQHSGLLVQPLLTAALKDAA